MLVSNGLSELLVRKKIKNLAQKARELSGQNIAFPTSTSENESIPSKKASVNDVYDFLVKLC